MISLSQLQTNVHKRLKPDHTQKDYDVIVVGVGSMGSSTCYHLAKQGLKVLGIEQFDIPHENGAHTGQTRIIRQAYFEHPSYVPLLKSAYDSWGQLEQESSSRLFFKTGLLYFGPEDHFLIKRSLESAHQHGIPINQISRQEQESKYPQFDVPGYYTRMIEVDGGFIPPERAILTFTDQALNNGAHIHTRESVLEWKRKHGSIQVKTDKGVYSCKKLVLASGAWSSKMVNTELLNVTRQVILWARTKMPDLFGLDHLPTWTYADPSVPGIYYGFPELPIESFGDPAGIKIAHHTKGEVTDPDNVKRTISKEEEVEVFENIQKFIPDLESVVASKTCLYTNSADDDFIVDLHPENDDVVVAAGFSGHGFKFASVMGEILKDLVTHGKTQHPIGFLSMKRFEDKSR